MALIFLHQLSVYHLTGQPCFKKHNAIGCFSYPFSVLFDLIWFPVIANQFLQDYQIIITAEILSVLGAVHFSIAPYSF